MTFRDIIVNASADAKLCDRTQVLPASIYESGKRLLANRIAQYSNSNLLEFSRRSIAFDYDKAKGKGKHSFNTDGITIGTYELEDGWNVGTDLFLLSDISEDKLPEATESMMHTVYAWDSKKPLELWSVSQYDVTSWYLTKTSYGWTKTSYPNIKTVSGHTEPRSLLKEYADVQVDIAPNTITRCYKDNEVLPFVSLEDFDSYSSDVWTSISRSTNITEFITNVKGKLKVFYNEPFEIDDFDKETRLPSQWNALLETALVVDFARAYPRLSDNTYGILKARLDELEHNIMRSSSVSKFLSRPSFSDSLKTYSAGLNGEFLR